METVVVGMSGGVDSSVTALLLHQQGFNVIGLFMNNWEEKDDCGVCTATQDFEDVRRVCDNIGVPYYSVNFSKQYYEKVFSEFLEEYQNNRTPNPDVLCNREIKFGPFLDFALSLGATKIATGHYAKVVEKDGLYYLKKAHDKSKDQSYFLNQLSQYQLSKVMFPLDEIDKTQVRKIASEHNLKTASKKDSTGVCFIGERNFKKFLQNYLPAHSGDIVDVNGKVVGKHDGVMFYTIGQRKGLNIGGLSGGTGERWFVLEKDVKNNKLIVSQGEDDKLFSKALISNKINWIPVKPNTNKFNCFAKFRYRQPDQKVEVELMDNQKVKVVFDKPQRAITTGQYVVFYDEDENCLGGGKIDEVIF